MNERAEKTNDVLSKLTVLGTIVLPMNIISKSDYIYIS
jgi:magnesium transporter